MAHELSHVLLASLWSPHKDSELHTDLVPIILGFREVVRRGRKIIESTTSGNTTTTHTTTYGYLTDTQFEFACNYVKERLRHHASEKSHLLTLVEQVQRKIRKAARSLATFRDYFNYLDNRRPKRMKKEHSQRMVQLHGKDYSCEWETQITAVKKSAEIAEAFVRPLNHYTTDIVERIRIHAGALEHGSDDLDQITKAITKDERILRKYVGFIYRLQKALRSHS
jgi:hypothetical protein